MDKVYIVIQTDGCYDHVNSVWSTKEKAEASIAKAQRNKRVLEGLDLFIEEYDLDEE